MTIKQALSSRGKPVLYQGVGCNHFMRIIYVLDRVEKSRRTGKVIAVLKDLRCNSLIRTGIENISEINDGVGL